MNTFFLEYLLVIDDIIKDISDIFLKCTVIGYVNYVNYIAQLTCLFVCWWNFFN